MQWVNQETVKEMLDALKIANRYLDTLAGYRGSTLKDLIVKAIDKAELNGCQCDMDTSKTINAELLKTLKESYDLSAFKGTEWAIKAKRAIDKAEVTQ